MSESLTGIHAKLAYIKGSVKPPVKTGNNTFHKYTYVTELDVLEVIKPLLHEHSINYSISFSDIIERSKEATNARGEVKTTNSVTVKATLTLTDGDDPTSFTVSESFGSAEDTGDKAVYKAMTGASKYVLLKEFGLASGDDPEAHTFEDCRSFIAEKGIDPSIVVEIVGFQLTPVKNDAKKMSEAYSKLFNYNLQTEHRNTMKKIHTVGA